MIGNSRLKREAETIKAMINLYCRYHHKSPATPCPVCTELLAYAFKRLEKCPFQKDKTTCAKCPVHCYSPEMREQVRKIMRFAGPMMLSHQPILTFLHSLDGLRRVPIR